MALILIVATADRIRADLSAPTDGTDTLVIALAGPATIEVGALGAQELPVSRCAYAGSAFAPAASPVSAAIGTQVQGSNQIQFHISYM